MTGKRRKRDQRDPHAPAMHLTERDIGILDMVYQCRVLTQAHIHALCFTGSSPTMPQRRLSLLYHHGFLARQFLPVQAGYLFSPALYLITQRGMAVLRAMRGLDDEPQKASNPTLAPQYLAHTVAINDVRVAVTLACRAHDYPLLAWCGEAAMKAAYDRVELRTRAGRRRSVSLIPDSYFAVDTPRGATHFFLELDRGTMTAKRFALKIAAYLAYYQSGAYEERYQTASLRVLTVTTGQRRLESLKRCVEDRDDEEDIHRFWFTRLNTITADTVLAAAIWQVAGNALPQVLIHPS